MIESILDESLEKFSNSMSERHTAFEVRLKNGMDEIKLDYKTALTLQADIDNRAHDEVDTSLFDSQDALIETLKVIIKCQDLEIATLKHQLETYELARPLSEYAEKFGNAAMDIQESMIDYQSTKVAKYTKGTKERSFVSKKNGRLLMNILKKKFQTIGI